MFIGHFARFKLKVSRKRLRKSLDRVKIHRNLPPRSKPFRRSYRQKAVLSMQHVDGYHHFIRYVGITMSSKEINFVISYNPSNVCVYAVLKTL